MKTLGQLLPQEWQRASQASMDLAIESICCDSRQVHPGSLFVAVKGEKQDGNAFIDQAIAAGAAALVVTDPALAQGHPHVVVPDSRAALSYLADAWWEHPSRQMTVIGVTGTNGKTTVSHMLHTILTAAGWRCGLIGTNHNLVGDAELAAHQTTPDALALHRLLHDMKEQGCRAVVMEVSSHALCHHRVDDVAFDEAIFTNLTQDHLDYHGDMDHYAAAKARLFALAQGGIVNGDDGYALLMEAAAGRPLTRYSIGDDTADLTARDVRATATGMNFLALSRGELVRVTLPLPGSFNVANALAALACAQAMGLDLSQSARALSDMKEVRGRAERVATPARYQVYIDYAHTPDGMERMLAALKESCQGRLIVVFGCGGDRDRGKRPLMGAAAARWADLTIVTSDNPRGEEPLAIIEDILPGLGQSAYETVPDRTQAIIRALSLGREGDTIALLGKGHETYQEVKGRRLALDERDVIRRYFAGEEQ